MHPRMSTIPQKTQTKPIQPEINEVQEVESETERTVVVTNDTRPLQRNGKIVERDLEISTTSRSTSSSVLRTGCITGNCANGNGVYVHPTQGSYKGSWRNGKRDGFGVHYYANGQKMYVGEFVLGKRYGSGTYYFSNGERYEGRFIDDKPTDNGNYVMTRSEEREIVDLIYIFSDGRKEIMKVQNQDEEEEN